MIDGADGADRRRTAPHVGPSIVGFGHYHYRTPSGREGDALLAGFAARKANLVVYLMGEIPEQAELLTRLDRIDRHVLEELVIRSVTAQRAKYPDST